VARGRIEVQGLKELQAALRRADADLPKTLRIALNKSSELVIMYAQKRMPSRTGRAKASLKARSSQRQARIAMGGRRAPHAPWLDFGGKVGKNRSVSRPFYRDGRYVYKGLAENQEEITETMSVALARVLKESGLGVD
jgi:hypothetical protein